MTQLVVDSLTVERGGRALFAPLSFTVGHHANAANGSLLRISGANGAGKTTLLRTLAGLSSAASGNVSWRSATNDDLDGATCVFMGHSNAMNDALSPYENLAYAEGARGTSLSRDTCKSALAALDVATLIDRRVGTLSQGQRKRVALAQLFLPWHAKAAWLLDEPFVALDAATQTLFALRLEAAISNGALVVLTSHQNVPINVAHRQEVMLEPFTRAAQAPTPASGSAIA